MDSQDQNIASVPAPQPSVAPGSPAPLSVPQTGPAPSYSAQHVQTDGDVTAVPQEQIGLDAAQMIPVPGDRLTAPAEVFAEATPQVEAVAVPESSLPVQPAESPVSELPPVTPVPESIPEAVAPPDQPVPSSPAVADAPAAEAASSEDSQKTPLEILEEILASANEGAPADGTSPESSSEDLASAEAKKQQEEEEARQAAARAAEEQRYRQEAEQRIGLAQQDLQAAAQQREEVTQQLQLEGKQVGPMTAATQDDKFEIQQLQHDTLSQNTN